MIAYVPFDGTAVDVAGGNAVVLGGSPTYVKTQGAKEFPQKIWSFQKDQSERV